MRINEITLRNYRGVRERTVKFAETGVTVVEGENEAGKSSLIEGLFLLLEVPDSSKSSAVESIRQIGKDLAPEVGARFRLGSSEIEYRKRWGKSPSTQETTLSIKGSTTEQVAGRSAHDRVSQLLSGNVDEQLWKALRLQQGAELKQGQVMTGSLGAALDAAAGGGGSADAHGPLIDRITAEYGEFWTPKGRESRVLSGAREASEEAAARALVLRGTLAALEADAERFDQLRRAREAVRADRVRNETRLREVRAAWAAVEKQRAVVERLGNETDRTRERAGAAREASMRRAQLVRQVEDSDRTVAGAEARAKALEPEHERLERERTSADGHHARTHQEARSARALRDLRAADESHWNELLFLDQMTERLARVNENEAAVTEAMAFIEAINVDADGLRRIERMQLTAVQARARADAEAPAIRVRALRAVTLTAAAGTVDLEAGEEREFAVEQPRPLRIADLAEVSVRSGSGAAESLKAAVDVEAAYSEACRAAGVPDVATARDLWERRQRMQQVLDHAREGLRQDLRDLTPQTLAERVERLKKNTALYVARRADEPALPASLDDAKRLKVIAEARFESAEADEARAAEVLREMLTALEQAGNSRRQADLEVENARGALTLATSALAEARSEVADEALEAAETTLAAAARVAEGELASAEGLLRESNPDGVRAELGNLELLLERLDSDARARDNELAGLKERLSARGEEGLAEHLAEAETDVYRKEQDWESIRRRAGAAKLLYDVFMRHRAEARKAYLQPFKEKLEALGRIVFGSSFELVLSQDLMVEKRTLDGVTVPYDSLSTGAKEQIGVLSRLACAALVSADGGVPLILDDALGWSDPGRLEKLGAAFNVGARDCQVIVLTCMPDRYRSIGSATVVRLSGDE
ncbi:MAG: AAA family ATPase [Dehalococcoidia bacterium]|nr:AAA family ATPase [Dehalococcoidia bacterium]MCB9485206.1 AAA family ATPase [Thermoflexaceae bacterium]